MTDSPVCLHPNCNQQLGRGRHVCLEHFKQLPDDMKGRLKGLGRLSVSARGARLCEVRDWFDSMLVGDNEAFICRWPDCDQEVIRMDGKYGQLNVNRKGVLPDDTCFDPSRHTAHKTTCANRDDYGRR